MVTADVSENDPLELLKRFDIFKRNKVPEIKLINSNVSAFQVRRIALLFNVGKSTVHYWIEKFKDT